MLSMRSFFREIPNLCYLCDPPCYNLETPEVLLEHIHTAHAYPVDYSKEVCKVYFMSLQSFCFFIPILVQDLSKISVPPTESIEIREGHFFRAGI